MGGSDPRGDEFTPATVGDWPPGLPPPATGVRLPGGNIGSTWRVTLTDGSAVVVKGCPYPAEIEADGYAALRSAGVPTPEVLGHRGSTLVMSHVDGSPDWVGLGAAVARMHQVGGQQYGWHRDNRSGRFVQHNARADDWPTFFAQNRVLTHLGDPTVPLAIAERLKQACGGSLQALLPRRPQPVLTHGDLWTGNIVAGRWIVDPEVSFGDRELDLVTLMSPKNPVPAEFWHGYCAVLPIPEGFDERRRIIGLHHRLLGVRHFGADFVAPLADDLDALGW